jgi:transposase InsO family protein
VAFSQVLPDERAMTAALFLVEAAGFFADHRGPHRAGVDRQRQGLCRVGGVRGDGRWAGIRLRRTRRYRPQTNGKVERFNKTLLEEWAYGRLYRSNDERRRAFTRWLRSYNHRRPHTSLDGLTPMAVLVNNVHGKHT